VNIAISRNDITQRYELHLDGRLASFTEFAREGDTVLLPHTFTVPRFRDQGLADQVVQAALDDIREQGLQVVPTCHFVADFIAEHPEYQPMVAAA
jgi:predicted GNAT family acetyltransferase